MIEGRGLIDLSLNGAVGIGHSRKLHLARHQIRKHDSHVVVSQTPPISMRYRAGTQQVMVLESRGKRCGGCAALYKAQRSGVQSTATRWSGAFSAT